MKHIRVPLVVAAVMATLTFMTVQAEIRRAPDFTKIAISNPWVYVANSGTSWQNYFINSTNDVKRSNHIRPEWKGATIASPEWWANGCYNGTISYSVGRWGKGPAYFDARAVLRRLPEGRNQCASWHYVDCMTFEKQKPTGHCNMTDKLANYVYILINKSQDSMAVGQHYLQHTSTHEMGHAFGLYHVASDNPDECLALGNFTLMWKGLCYDWPLLQRRGDFGSWDLQNLNRFY